MKKLTSIILLLLFLFGIFGTLDRPVNRILKKVDTGTSEHITELSLKAGATFGVAKSLNAIISVLQGTEISAIATIAVGEALDPVNDLVEKFSNVMLLSLTSLGIQLILHQVGIDFATRWFLSLAFLFGALTMLKPQKTEERGVGGFKKQLSKILNFSEPLTHTMILFFIILRLFIPVTAYISKSTETIIMSKYEDAQSGLKQISDEGSKVSDSIQDQSISDGEEDESQPSVNFTNRVMDSIKDFSSSVVNRISNLNIKDKIDKYIVVLSNSTSKIIDLIVIFVFQTILLPIGTLWLIKAMAVPVLKTIITNTEKFDSRKSQQVMAYSSAELSDHYADEAENSGESGTNN